MGEEVEQNEDEETGEKKAEKEAPISSYEFNFNIFFSRLTFPPPALFFFFKLKNINDNCCLTYT